MKNFRSDKKLKRKKAKKDWDKKKNILKSWKNKQEGGFSGGVPVHFVKRKKINENRSK